MADFGTVAQLNQAISNWHMCGSPQLNNIKSKMLYLQTKYASRIIVERNID